MNKYTTVRPQICQGTLLKFTEFLVSLKLGTALACVALKINLHSSVLQKTERSSICKHLF
jgi:hypothetical protein